MGKPNTSCLNELSGGLCLENRNYEERQRQIGTDIRRKAFAKEKKEQGFWEIGKKGSRELLKKWWTRQSRYSATTVTEVG